MGALGFDDYEFPPELERAMRPHSHCRPCRGCGNQDASAFLRSSDFCESCLPGILHEIRETGGH